MAYTFEIKNIQLETGKLGVSRQEYTYNVSFKLVSDTFVYTVVATQWLVANIPWSLADYGDSYAFANTYNVNTPDPNGGKIFYGTIQYVHNSPNTKVWFDQNVYEVELFKALDESDKEVAIVNSVSDRPGTPVIETEKRMVIVVSKTYDPAFTGPEGIMDYDNSVNINPIWIANVAIPARGGWIQLPQPEIVPITRTTYNWQVTMRIEVRGVGKTYDKELLDRGYNYLLPFVSTGDIEADASDIIFKNGSQYRRVPATVRNSDTGKTEPVSEPILLDGNGGKLEDTTPGNEKYITYQTKKKRDWSWLALPRTIWEVI